jgi:alpha-tubulin suppressor-like RCC1 family protein
MSGSCFYLVFFLFSLSGYCKIVKIAAGFYHTVALKSNGTVVAWGDNGMGNVMFQRV